MNATFRFSAPLLVGAMFFSGCATPPPETEPSLRSEMDASVDLIAATADLAGTDATLLHPNYVWATLKHREQDTKINAAFEQALTQRTPESQLALVRALELKFIHDPKTSGLDILGPELSQHFRRFEWQENDFPGSPDGPNEQFADVMVDVVDLVRPERRANSTRDAVVLRAEATDAVWEYMTGQWVAVPGQERWMLNRHAKDSFVRMREQATAEGVDLVILSAHRRRQTAEANAARAGNSNAVASFSSHSLGLAIDFDMSHRDEIKFRGLSTRPMSELVRMRESPVHKWLLLRGEEFGWYPYQNEPWHWEYNPPGFREIFWADFPGGAPARGIIVEEP
ncbi:MAG TPA: M15 family metallopeptidase [Candidatus Paceibacterota bacterium]|nr:M15 family metallopeptidase [Verrucomicrobiota bacterium]HSA11142.1 M15 family metallopeptidase [Candidatus Paceibacterota bacterium]